MSFHKPGILRQGRERSDKKFVKGVRSLRRGGKLFKAIPLLTAGGNQLSVATRPKGSQPKLASGRGDGCFSSIQLCIFIV